MTTMTLSASEGLSAILHTTRSGCALAAMALLAAVSLSSGPVWASGNCAGCTALLRQATHITTGNVWLPAVSPQEGDFVTFTSDGDVQVGGQRVVPNGKNVYLYDAFNDMTIRVTDDGNSYDATRLCDDGPRGRFLAFISTGDFDPGVGNADGNPELFFWKLGTGEIVQITNTLAPVVNSAPFISDSGMCVTFHSNGDLGSNNADGSVEAFIYDVNDNSTLAGAFTQMSDGPAGTTSSNTAVGGYYWPRQCSNASFESDHDQLGNGAQGTNIYVYDPSADRILDAVPLNGYVSPGLSVNPSMSAVSRVARGPFIVFQSNADIFGNNSTGFEIFRYRALHPKVVQYTFSDGDSEHPVVSDGGGFVAFQSTGELLESGSNTGGPFNSDHNKEIFRMKGRRRIQQITQSSGCENTSPSIGEYRGRVVAFRSTCELVPNHNPNGLPQVYYYRDAKSRSSRQNRSESAIIDACTPESGCCREDTCYGVIFGKAGKPPKPNRAKLRIMR